MFSHTSKFQLLLGEKICKDFHDIIPCNILTLSPHLWPRFTPEGHKMMLFIISYSSPLKWDVVLLSYTLEFPWPKSALCQVGWTWPSDSVGEDNIVTTTTMTTTDNGQLFTRKTHLSFRLSWDKNCISLDLFSFVLYVILVFCITISILY